MVAMQDRWFPSAEHSSVVGRFIEKMVESASASQAAGKSTFVPKVLLESKVAGTHDVAAQLVKPFNEADFRSRFPGAWEHFQAEREANQARVALQPEHVPVRDPNGATPLGAVDFLPKDKISWLHDLGFTSVEQIAEMSDAQVQAVGRGAMSWRKAAQGWLKRT